MSEGGLALGAVLLLALAALARGLALGRKQRWWGPLSTGCRLAAAAALAAALISSILAHGGWSPRDVAQTALALSLAMLCIQMILAWRLGAEGASPVADLLALLVLLFGVWVVRSDAPALTCLQHTPAFHIQSALFLIGMGGVEVAGSAGLFLVLQALLSRLGRAGRLPPVHEMQALLRQSTALALAILGSGLIIAVWWAWRATGSLYSGDLREIWMASTWLVAGTSLLSWEIGKRPAAWAAGLSLGAAIMGLVGLLV